MFKLVFSKEWHYQRWKLFFGTVMLVFFTASLWAARVTTDNEVYIIMWMLGSLALSLFSAMGVFAPETTDGTRIFLVAKPVRSWKVFWAKWLMGWLNFAVPLLVCGFAVTLAILFRPDDKWDEFAFIARGTIASIGFGTIFYTMTCCFAPRKGGEATVAVTGLFVFLSIIFHLVLMDSLATTIRQMLLFQIVSEKMVEYINPIMWGEVFDSPLKGKELSILLLMQSLLFGLTATIGYRKWKRS